MTEEPSETMELERYEPAPAPLTLFGTSDPRVALERMAEIATALIDVIETKKLYATINGRRHITCEGWTTLGGMLGVVPVVTATRPNDTGDGIVAHVEARTLDGRIVGAAEAECSRAERTWKTRDPFTLRSMAQTRAISRALRAPLGQIVVLAGYEPAGAEEIPAEAISSTEETATESGPIPPDLRPTSGQAAHAGDLLARLAAIDPETDWAERAREIAGCPRDHMTVTIMGRVIEQLEKKLGELQPQADDGEGAA
jgi:hypothetical protein